MNREEITRAICAYRPCNEQEKRDQQAICMALSTYENIFTRENPLMHMTASAWIVNPARNRVLMAYHRIYNSWAWLGGHADGETNLMQVALREAREESGLTRVHPATEEIFSLEILTVDGHVKRGQYVSSHLHLNVTYLLEADDAQSLHIKPDENSGVAWFAPAQAVDAASEPWFCERIYKKLNAKAGLLL